MSIDAKVRFFDGIADKWDGWEDLDLLAEKFSHALDELGLGPDECVLDVGCGTGNLTEALLGKLSAKGRVVAIDISPLMVQRARTKVVDDRVAWHVTDAQRLPLEEASVDRVICFSVWPHFDDPEAVIRELSRVLRPAGHLHVWHLASRAAINEIHAKAGEAVSRDILLSAAETARLLERHRFVPYEKVDDDARYLVSAQKPRDPG